MFINIIKITPILVIILIFNKLKWTNHPILVLKKFVFLICTLDFISCLGELWHHYIFGTWEMFIFLDENELYRVYILNICSMIYSQDLLEFNSRILIVVSKFHVMRHYYYPNFTHNFLVMIVNVLTIEKA